MDQHSGLEFLDVSFDFSFQQSNISEKHHVNDPNNLDFSFNLNDSLPTINSSATSDNGHDLMKQSSVNAQTQLLVGHYLKHNSSYNSLEGMARIMNSMDNTSIQVPQTKYKIMKEMDPQFHMEYYIKCNK